MCFVFRLLWVLLIVGCNPVIDPGVPAYVTVLEVVGEGDHRLQLEGVTICETGTTNCAVTDMNGEATLWLPPNEEVSVTAEKEGYLSLLRADVTDVEELRPRFLMYSNEVTTPWWDALDSPYPQMGTAAVGVGTGSSLEGVTFSLLDATGNAFYNEPPSCGGCNNTPRLHCDDAPDPCLTETTSEGTGGFVEVPLAQGEVQGEVQIKIEVVGTDRDCVPIEAWPGDGRNRIRVPIRAGYFTGARVTCPP